MPIHWNLFDLAFHGWTEPIEQMLATAKTENMRVTMPRPRKSMEPDVEIPIAR